jgi:hypothetical protein
MEEYNEELFQAIKSNSAQDFLEQQCIKRLKEEYEYDDDSEEKEPTKKID